MLVQIIATILAPFVTTLLSKLYSQSKKFYNLSFIFLKNYFVLSKKQKKEKWISNFLLLNPDCNRRNAEWSYNRHLDSFKPRTNGQSIPDEPSNKNVRSDLKECDVKEIKRVRYEGIKKRYDCLIFGSKCDRNLGTMIRTSEIMGVSKVYIANCTKMIPVGAVGSQYYIDYEYVNVNEENFQMFIQKNNFYLIIVEQDGQNLNNVNFTCIPTDKIPLFVLGNESYGVPDYILRNCDIIVTIPQIGVIKSMNVTTAHSLILWEFIRQSNLI